MAIPTDVEGTWFNSTVSLDAGELRRADAAMFAGDGTTTTWVTGGIARHADTSLAVTVDGSDVVTVQPGAVVIPGNAVSGTGVYRAALTSAITGALAARNATNPRITLVIFRAYDDDVVGTHNAYKGTIEFVNGTPAASPVSPSLPSMAVELARITVPQTGGGAASVDATNRTYAAGLGGEIIASTFTKLPASAAKFQTARVLDTGARYEFDTTWVSLTPVCSVERASSTQSISTSTWTDLSFDTELIDTDSAYSGSGTTITVPKTGTYQVLARCGFATNSSGMRGVQIMHNGTAKVSNNVGAASVVLPAAVEATRLLALTAGDTIKAQAYQSSGGSLATAPFASIEYRPRLEIAWIRR